MSDRKSVPFYGIVSVGNSKDEAVNRYKMAAAGKKVSAYVDKGQSLSFVTTAHNLTEMFNPMTGDLDLEENPGLMDKLEFQAKASQASEANYFECKAGCGAHVVYDSEELVQHCPVCTTPVTASDEEDGESDGDEDADDDMADEDMDASDDGGESSESSEGDDAEETTEVKDPETPAAEVAEPTSDATAPVSADTPAAPAVASDDSEDDGGEGEGDEDSDEESDEADEGSDEESDEADEDSDEGGEDSSSDLEPVVVAGASKEEAIAMYQKERIGVIHASAVEVNYKVCSSADCGAHVIYEGEDLAGCPSCSSELTEPEEDEDDEEADLEVMPSDDEEDTDGDKSSESSEDTAEPTEPVTVDALNNIDDKAEDAHSKLDVAYSSSIGGAATWTAYYDGQPVAMARKSESKHQDIFDEGSFGRAVLASAKHVGVVNTLREMGFKALSTTLNVERYVQQQIDQGLADERTALASSQKEFKERMMAALATASIGLTRGFFVGQVNPLKDQLFQALSAAGVRNPDVLLFNAFKGASDQYHQILFAKASEILEKPVEIQEGLAKAVLEVNYTGTASASSNSVEDRLSALGTAAKPAQDQPAHVSTSSEDGGFGAKAASVVSGLGRRFRT